MRKIETTRIRDTHPQLGTKEECYKKHYKMVHKVANRYQHLRFYGVDMDDLISEGTIGLLNAYDRFDPTKTKAQKFSTFAFPYVKGYILRYLEGGVQLIHIPYHSGLRPKTITRIDRKIESKDGSKLELSEMIPIPEDETQFDVDCFISSLSPGDQTIVTMLMDGYTYRTIGKQIGVSANTVRKYKKRIAGKYAQVAQ
ncbi:sigma-70 family RNA polymerase sigma factor [Paenibacillus sp. BAC0078]